MHADQIHVGGVESVPGEERFDLVAALHVIEHMYDPAAFTRSLASRVKEGGHLLLATPNAGSFWLPLLRRRWPSFKFPEHIVFFDRGALKTLLGNAGLQDLKQVPYPHAFPVCEIYRKLGLPDTLPMGSRSAWIPATTIAFAGRVPD